MVRKISQRRLYFEVYRVGFSVLWKPITTKEARDTAAASKKIAMSDPDNEQEVNIVMLGNEPLTGAEYRRIKAEIEAFMKDSGATVYSEDVTILQVKNA